MRLALVQSPATLPTPQARLAWLRDALPEISGKGADLVLLPELFACGYHIPDHLADRAEPLDGPTFTAMAALAKTFDLAIHYGFAERGEGVLHNACACVAPDGTLLGHQRKLTIPPGFEEDHFAPGQGCALFDYAGLRVATLICFDAEFPETVRHVAAQGADLVLVPTALGADWGWVAQTMIPTRAYENGVYLAYANSAGVENGMAFLGASVIAGPAGHEVARAGAAPDVLYADIDRSAVKAAQERLPYLRHLHAISL